jgi:hypothetical protein
VSSVLEKGRPAGAWRPYGWRDDPPAPILSTRPDKIDPRQWLLRGKLFELFTCPPSLFIVHRVAGRKDEDGQRAVTVVRHVERTARPSPGTRASNGSRSCSITGARRPIRYVIRRAQ